MNEHEINNLDGGSQWESEKHPASSSTISKTCNCAESATVADMRKSGTQAGTRGRPRLRVNQCQVVEEVALVITDESMAALIDVEDVERINPYHWVVKRNRNGSPYLYACGAGYLHRFVLGFGDFRAMQAAGHKRCYVDHINYNTLDCRKENLRPCTQAENGAASRRPSSNPWGFRGIRFFRGNRWMAQLGRKYGGVFKTPEEAARAYDRLAYERWGEFAQLNFPKEAYGTREVGRD